MAVCLFLIAILLFIFREIAHSANHNLTRHGIIPLPPVEIIGNFNATSHFQYPHVQKYCNVTNRDTICKSNSTRVCAARPTRRNIKSVSDMQRDLERKDFNNSCHLFLSNMCETPEYEYYIISDTDCESYLARRRSELTVTTDATNTTEATVATANATDAVNATGAANATSPTEPPYTGNANDDFLAEVIGEGPKKRNTNSSLRTEEGKKSDWPNYTEQWAPCGHICPLICPETYKPVCFIANRAKGVYMKVFTFVNHCLGDLYYCEHPSEFAGPPGEELDVEPSDISWVFCAAYKYVSFARFSEVASSMGHYGWLAGDYKSTRILEPHERLPGYGRK